MTEQRFDGVLSLMDMQAATPSTAAQGTLTLADIDSMFESMYANARAEPEVLYVSLADMRRVRHWHRLGAIYRGCPSPRYPLRKCHMRRLQARWNKGRRALARLERKEATAEQAHASLQENKA